MNNAIKRLTE